MKWLFSFNVFIFPVLSFTLNKDKVTYLLALTLQNYLKYSLEQVCKKKYIKNR